MNTIHAPEQRRQVSRIIRLFNTLPKLLLRSPLHSLMSSRLLLLTFTGRKSGKHYIIPISYVQVCQTLPLASDRPWWKNLQGGASVHLWLRGKERTAVAEVLTDEAAVAELYRTILAENPIQGRFMAISPGPDGRPDADDLRRALERGIAVIRLHLD